MLQHRIPRCNTVQHVATQCTILQDRLALGRLSRTVAIELRECAEQRALLPVVLMRGGEQAAGGMGGLGAGAGACSVRVARARVGCVGRRLHVVDQKEEADCVEDDSRRIVRVGVAKGRRPEESGVRRQERPFADLKPNLCTNRERSRRSC